MKDTPTNIKEVSSHVNDALDSEDVKKNETDDLSQYVDRKPILNTAPSPYSDEALHRVPRYLRKKIEYGKRDSAWKTLITRECKNFLKNSIYDGTSFIDATCSEHLCELKFEHDSRSSQEVFIVEGMQRGPWKESFMTFFDDTQDSRGTSIFALADIVPVSIHDMVAQAEQEMVNK
jgi:hypothetical protein